MQNMLADVPEVQGLLTALTHKIRVSTEELDKQAIGNALYGMKNMSADVPAVQAFLRALTPKIRVSTAELDNQAIGNALYGMQNMSADVPAVQAFLRALTPKIQESTAVLSPQAIGNALYGMKNMSARLPEVKALLAVLAVKICAPGVNLDAKGFAQALYGLKNMLLQDHVNEVEEVTTIFNILAQKVTTARQNDSFSSALADDKDNCLDHSSIPTPVGSTAECMEYPFELRDGDPDRAAVSDTEQTRIVTMLMPVWTLVPTWVVVQWPVIKQISREFLCIMLEENKIIDTHWRRIDFLQTYESILQLIPTWRLSLQPVLHKLVSRLPKPSESQPLYQATLFGQKSLNTQNARLPESHELGNSFT